MTEDRRRYSRPPVVEALAEAYFEGGGLDQTLHGVFYERVKDRFPLRGGMNELEVNVVLGPARARTETVAGPLRSQFRAADESRMVQVGPGLLVVNQLRPYPRFEAWSPIFMEMVELYREIVQPTERRNPAHSLILGNEGDKAMDRCQAMADEMTRHVRIYRVGSPWRRS